MVYDSTAIDRSDAALVAGPGRQRRGIQRGGELGDDRASRSRPDRAILLPTWAQRLRRFYDCLQ